jgi:hypothetical protein
VPSTLTVRAAGEANSKVSAVLGQWVRACGITGDRGNVRVAELLPQYARLLCCSQHRSKQLTARTVYLYLRALGNFLGSRSSSRHCKAVVWTTLKCCAA